MTRDHKRGGWDADEGVMTEFSDLKKVNHKEGEKLTHNLFCTKRLRMNKPDTFLEQQVKVG